MRKTPLFSLLGLISALSLPAAVMAANVEWASASDGGLWSEGANWSGSTAPGAADTAVLGSASADRVIVFDTSAASTNIGGLSLSQSADFTNTLSVRRSMLSISEIIVGASSGQSVLRLETNNSNADGYQLFTSSNQVLLNTPKLTVNDGGTVYLSRKLSQSGNTVSPVYVRGDVDISGGSLIFDKYIRYDNSSGSYSYTVDGNVTMSSGKFEYSVTPSSFAGYAVGDTRVTITGNLIVTGGMINTPANNSGGIFLEGATNSLTNLTLGQYVHLNLSSAIDQTLSSTAVLNSLILRSAKTSTKTVTVANNAATGNIGSIAFIQGTNGGTTTLAMGSDLKLKNNTSITTSTLGAPASGSTVNFVINTGGHTLDATLGDLNLKDVSANVASAWTINGGGTVRARTFDFSMASAGVSVGAGTRLVATGNGITINLGSQGGTIAEDSSLTYDGGAGNSATLVSNRAIGGLRVESGDLLVAGDDDIEVRGGVFVAAGATLDVGVRKITASNWTIGLGGSSAGGISGDALTVDGELILAFDSPVVAGTYNLFDVAALDGSFTSVALSGIYNISLIEAAGIWSGSVGGYTFSFDTAGGMLTVMAVPEPGSAAILGALVLGLGALVRLRRKK